MKGVSMKVVPISLRHQHVERREPRPRLLEDTVLAFLTGIVTATILAVLLA